MTTKVHSAVFAGKKTLCLLEIKKTNDRILPELYDVSASNASFHYSDKIRFLLQPNRLSNLIQSNHLTILTMEI